MCCVQGVLEEFVYVLKIWNVRAAQSSNMGRIWIWGKRLWDQTQEQSDSNSQHSFNRGPELRGQVQNRPIVCHKEGVWSNSCFVSSEASWTWHAEPCTKTPHQGRDRGGQTDSQGEEGGAGETESRQGPGEGGEERGAAEEERGGGEPQEPPAGELPQESDRLHRPRCCLHGPSEICILKLTLGHTEYTWLLAITSVST